MGAEDGSNLLPAIDEMAHYDTLRNWTSDQWAALLKKFVISCFMLIYNIN